MKRRRRTEEPADESKDEEHREPAERFEFNDDVLEVPSFLRD
jgi:hypothetical protein